MTLLPFSYDVPASVDQCTCSLAFAKGCKPLNIAFDHIAYYLLDTWPSIFILKITYYFINLFMSDLFCNRFGRMQWLANRLNDQRLKLHTNSEPQGCSCEWRERSHGMCSLTDAWCCVPQDSLAQLKAAVPGSGALAQDAACLQRCGKAPAAAPVASG